MLQPSNIKSKIGRETFKGPLSGLRQSLTIESSLKMMKTAFYFMLKALFVLEISLVLLFGYVRKTS